MYFKGKLHSLSQVRGTQMCVPVTSTCIVKCAVQYFSSYDVAYQRLFLTVHRLFGTLWIPRIQQLHADDVHLSVSYVQAAHIDLIQMSTSVHSKKCRYIILTTCSLNCFKQQVVSHHLPAKGAKHTIDPHYTSPKVHLMPGLLSHFVSPLIKHVLQFLLSFSGGLTNAFQPSICYKNLIITVTVFSPSEYYL